MPLDPAREYAYEPQSSLQRLRPASEGADTLRELALGAGKGDQPFFRPTVRNRAALRLALHTIARMIPVTEHEARGLAALLREFGDVRPQDTS